MLSGAGQISEWEHGLRRAWRAGMPTGAGGLVLGRRTEGVCGHMAPGKLQSGRELAEHGKAMQL